MLKTEVSTPPPEPSFPQTLADLSRNASTISSSSSSDSTSSLLLKTPRPRPLRTFSSPRSRTRSPHSPQAQNSRPPSYLTRELGVSDNHGPSVEARIASARRRSKSRNPSVNGRLSAEDFQFGETLGEGAYSTVLRGTYLATGQDYAIKVLDKGHLVRNNKMETALTERNTLARLGNGNPGIVRLHWTFHDEWSLYFVLDLAKNGELQSRISRMGSLSTACTQYYTAQIVDALDYMHSKGVIHRDLKPENLLLDDAFRIKITDFGTAKLLESGVERAKTWVGTAQYVAPELLELCETSKASDMWALGCVVYQMIAGRFAFQGLSEYLTWQKVKQMDYTFPEGFDEQAKDLVQKLLVHEPSERLGAGASDSPSSMAALRAHPFFANISWSTLWTDPAPPLESGLVKKEHPLASGADQNWEDVGAAWDELVDAGDDDDDDDGTDGMPWAPDAKGPAYLMATQNAANGSRATGYVNSPLGETSREDVKEAIGLPRDSSPGQLSEETATIMGHGDAAARSPSGGRGESTTRALSVPAEADAESATSSSEGSPVEKLGGALEALEVERGRNRSLTPVQGNGPTSTVDWSSVLAPGETILYSSPVEARAIRRRASRLLPIPVSPMKPKTRQLVLTPNRLLCLKLSSKGSGVGIKSELALRATDRAKDDKGKEKEGKSIVQSVEPKGEREFVVLTSSKSQSYAAPSASLAKTWVQKINEVLTSRPQVKPRT